MANEASKYDLLVLGTTAVGAKLEPLVKGEGEGSADFDAARYFAHAGRIIQENGADRGGVSADLRWDGEPEGDYRVEWVAVGIIPLRTKDHLPFGTFTRVNSNPGPFVKVAP